MLSTKAQEEDFITADPTKSYTVDIPVVNHDT